MVCVMIHTRVCIYLSARFFLIIVEARHLALVVGCRFDSSILYQNAIARRIHMYCCASIGVLCDCCSVQPYRDTHC